MDPPADGCLLCASTWGDHWEVTGGRSEFFCCELCARQWKTILREVTRATGWPDAGAVEIEGDRWGRTGVARRDGAEFRFATAFTPDARLRRFEPIPVAPAPVPPAVAAPPAPEPAAVAPPVVPAPLEAGTLPPALEERLIYEADTYPDLSSVAVEEGRTLVRSMASELDRARGPPEAVAQITSTSFRADGHRVAVRVYTAADGAAPRPVVVYFHGGGFVFGDLDTHDHLCREIASRSRSVVVSVAYRRAPEAKFPAAVEDALAALAWVTAPATAGRLEMDPGRVAVAGDDAGGNLAAVVAQAAHTAGGPAIAAQVLLYPLLARRPALPSYADQAVGYGLEASYVEWCWDQYVGPDAGTADPRATPGAAPGFAGLPPALIVTAGLDPVRDEAEAYGEQLRAAGGLVVVRRFPGMVHGFIEYRAIVPEGGAALDAVGAFLRERLGTE